jgi:hypothetical protein
MANDCDCKIRITGEPEDVKRLNDKLQCDEVQKNGSLHSGNYELLFESIDDVEDWGSKWQVFSNVDYSEGDTMMFIDGYSAWSPAEGLWKKISKDFNLSITCEYSEQGMGFAGITSWNDGEETGREEMSYWEYLYDNDNEYFWENIGYQCEYDSIDGVKETLGEVYENFDDSEKQQLEELHQERFVE